MEGVRGHDPAWGHREGHLCDLWINTWCHCPLGCIQAGQSAAIPPPLWSVGLGCCDWASVTDRPWWESRLKARLCDCRARPGQGWRRPRETESTVDSPGPGPGAPPVPQSTSCLCHSTSKSNPWSKAKEKKGEEKREETEKWKGRGRLTWVLGGKGRKQQTALYLTGEAAARAGAPVCLLPPRRTPSSALVPTSARPMKGCHGNTPGPQSEINNLSTSSEEGNL